MIDMGLFIENVKSLSEYKPERDRLSDDDKELYDLLMCICTKEVAISDLIAEGVTPEKVALIEEKLNPSQILERYYGGASRLDKRFRSVSSMRVKKRRGFF